MDTAKNCRRQALLGLGSNLGDRAGYLRAAVEALGALPATRLLGCSSFIETVPVECPLGAPAFLNAVVAVETELSPEELLAGALEIEAANGRLRSVPNAPRTLDIDLLFYEGEQRDTEFLVLPHPRWHERDFVQKPLYELLDNMGASAASIREMLSSRPPARARASHARR